MQLDPKGTLTRRAMLGAAGLAGLAALTGCSVFGSSPETITVTAAPTGSTPAQPTNPDASPTALMGLIFTTRLHVSRLESAITSDPDKAALFSLLLKDRKAHLAALTAEYTRQFGAPPGGGTDSGTGAPSAAPTTETSDAAADADEVLGGIRGDATTAQNSFTDAMATASRFQAQLFGSIAACIATHRMVLS